MRFPYGRTVTVLRRGVEVEPYSGATSLGSWDMATGHPIHGCAIAPGVSSDESEVDRDRLDSHITVYAAWGVDILPTDRIVTPDGEVWDVDGLPAHWESPYTGRKFGAVITCKRSRP